MTNDNNNFGYFRCFEASAALAKALSATNPPSLAMPSSRLPVILEELKKFCSNADDFARLVGWVRWSAKTPDPAGPRFSEGGV